MADDALTSRAYWQKTSVRPEPVEIRSNPLGSVLERFLPADPSLSCAEVGAYPGGNLCWLARRFGYRATAIEYREDAADIAGLFAFNGLPPPEILVADFFSISGRAFDVVASLGFAEHFRDFGAVVARHADLVRPGGYLVLSVPHFWGYQGLVRKALFTKAALEELRATHNLDAMHLPRVREALRESGMEILYAGHRMNASLWFDPDSPKIRPGARAAARALSWLDRTVGRRLPSCFLYSPMILTVSRKPRTGKPESP